MEPGYKKTLIKPFIPKDLPSAGANLQTIYGKLSCHWVKNGGELTVNIDIPPGVNVLVSLPGDNMTCCGLPIKGARLGDWTVMEYPSGKYNFKTRS